MYTPLTPNKSSLLRSHQTNHHSSPHSSHTKQTIAPLHTPVTLSKPSLLCILPSHQTITLLHTPLTPRKPLLLCTLLSHQANHYSSAHACHTKQTITPLHTPVTPSKPLLLCALLSHQASHQMGKPLDTSPAHSCHTKQTT